MKLYSSTCDFLLTAFPSQGCERHRRRLPRLMLAGLLGIWICSLPLARLAAQEVPPMPPQVDESGGVQSERANGARGGRRSSSVYGRQANDLKKAFQPVTQPLADAIISITDRDEQIGLGLIVDEKGHIVTKASLWNEAFQVQLPSGKKVTAQLVAQDPNLDLALLKVESTPRVPLTWSANGQTKPGNFVVNAGRQGEVLGLGVLSIEPREFRMQVPRGAFLGVSTASLTEPVGLEVTRVVADSAALQAGLREGDKITHISGRELRAPEQLSQFVSSLRPGDEVELRVLRDSSEVVLKAKLRPRTLDTSNLDRWGGGPFTASQRFGFGRVYAHDAHLNPADAGGPLVNSRGEIVGINISRALRVSTYAIPAEQVQSFIQSALR